MFYYPKKPITHVILSKYFRSIEKKITVEFTYQEENRKPQWMLPARGEDAHMGSSHPTGRMGGSGSES